jgi:hypothetical protein
VHQIVQIEISKLFVYARTLLENDCPRLALRGCCISTESALRNSVKSYNLALSFEQAILAAMMQEVCRTLMKQFASESFSPRCDSPRCDKCTTRILYAHTRHISLEILNQVYTALHKKLGQSGQLCKKSNFSDFDCCVFGCFGLNQAVALMMVGGIDNLCWQHDKNCGREFVPVLIFNFGERPAVFEKACYCQFYNLQS